MGKTFSNEYSTVRNLDSKGD